MILLDKNINFNEIKPLVCVYLKPSNQTSKESLQVFSFKTLFLNINQGNVHM